MSPAACYYRSRPASKPEGAATTVDSKELDSGARLRS